MALFSVLLLRAAFSVSLFVLFLVHQDSVPWITLYTSLMYYSAFVLITTPTASSNIGSRFASLQLLSLVVNCWMWVEARTVDIHISDVFIDNALPYFQYRQTLVLISEDLANVIVFMDNLRKQLGLSFQKGLYIFVFLCVHALLLLFLIDYIYVSFYSLLTTKVTENFYSSLNQNVSVLYPEGYFYHKVLERRSYTQVVFQEEIYSHILAHNIRRITRKKRS